MARQIYWPLFVLGGKKAKQNVGRSSDKTHGYLMSTTENLPHIITVILQNQHLNFSAYATQLNSLVWRKKRPVQFMLASQRVACRLPRPICGLSSLPRPIWTVNSPI